MILIDLNRYFFSELNRFKEELLESNIVDRPQDTSERLVKQLQDHTEFLREELRNKNNMINCLLEQLLRRDDTIFSYKNQFYNLKQKLSDLHTAESNSYNSIDNNDFMNKGVKITIKAIKVKVALNFMIIQVSIKAFTQKFQYMTSSILIVNLLRS